MWYGKVNVIYIMKLKNKLLCWNCIKNYWQMVHRLFFLIRCKKNCPQRIDITWASKRLITNSITRFLSFMSNNRVSNVRCTRKHWCKIFDRNERATEVRWFNENSKQFFGKMRKTEKNVRKHFLKIGGAV